MAGKQSWTDPKVKQIFAIDNNEASVQHLEKLLNLHGLPYTDFGTRGSDHQARVQLTYANFEDFMQFGLSERGMGIFADPGRGKTRHLKAGCT